MSFVLQYLRLYTVAMQDADGEALPGFAFTPTSRTRRRLADHQLVFRSREAGFEVYYRLNPQAGDPLLGRITQRVRFTFLFTQRDAGFFTRYEPMLTPATGPQLYLDNLTASGTIQPAATVTLTADAVVQPADAVKIHPRKFLAATDIAGPPPPTRFTVRDKFAPDTVVLQAPIAVTPGARRAATTIDLSARPPGVYTLETDAPGAAPRTIYADDDVAGTPALGVVDVHWQTPQDTAPAGGAAYVIRFRER